MHKFMVYNSQGLVLRLATKAALGTNALIVCKTPWEYCDLLKMRCLLAEADSIVSCPQTYSDGTSNLRIVLPSIEHQISR